MYSNETSLTEQFAHICRLLHMAHHHRHQKHGPTADPHRGQGRVLALLMMQPEISQKELSYLLDIRPQSLGELLAKLERSGHIIRTPSEEDNRVMNIRLTETGVAATRNLSEDEPDMFGDLSAGERDELSGYLSRVIAGLEQRLGDAMPRHRPHDGPHGHDCRRGREGRGHGCGEWPEEEDRRRHRGHPGMGRRGRGEDCGDCRRRPAGGRDREPEERH